MEISWTAFFAIIGFLFSASIIGMCIGGFDGGGDRYSPACIKTQCEKCQNKLNIVSKFCERCGAKV